MIRYLLFATDLVVVVLTCLTALHALRISGLAARFVSFLVLLYSVLVLPTPVLSHLNLLGSQTAHLLAHGVVFCAVYAFAWVKHRSRPTLTLLASLLRPPAVPWRSARNHPDVVFLAASLAGVYLVNLAVVLFVAQSNNDAMAYHMPRVMYWLRHGNFRHFPSYWIYQPTAPMASSLATLWTMLHTGGERLVGLVQYSAVLGSSAAIYGMSRLLGCNRLQSLLAGLVWLSYPIVALQSTTAQNDMTAAFLVGASVYLFVLGLKDAHHGAAVVSALALGAALGTKVTVLLTAASFGLLAIWAALRAGQKGLLKTLSWSGCVVISALLLASPTYLQNLRITGHPLGPQGKTEADYLPTTTVAGTAATLARYGFEAVDTTGLPRKVEPYLQHVLAHVGRRVFSALRLDPNGPPQNISSTCAFGFYSPPEDAPVHWGPRRDRRREEAAWMGPVGALLFIPCLLLASFRWRRRDGWHLGAVLGWMCLLYVLLVSAVLPWSPWRGRYMAMAAVIGGPLVAVVFHSRFRRWSFRTAICLLSGVVVWNAVLFSNSRPLVGQNAVFLSDFARQRTANQSVQLAMIRALDEVAPDDATVGAVGVRYEYHLFGRHLTRIVAPTFLRSTTQPTLRETSSSSEYLVIGADYLRSSPIEGVVGYVRIRSGGWGEIHVRDDRLGEVTLREKAQLERQNLAEVLPATISTDATVRRLLRSRQAPALGPWGFEHRNWFWMGEGVAQGVKLHLHAKEAFGAVVTVDVAPGPSRRGRERTVEFAVSGGDGDVVQTAKVESRTTLAFEVTIPEGDVTLTFACLDEADIPVLPNGDTRPLLLQCFGIALQAAD